MLVAEKDIKLTPTEPVPATAPPVQARQTKLDGSLKGQVKGEAPESQEAEEVIAETETTETEPGGKVGQPADKEYIGTLINQVSSNLQSMFDHKINQLNANMAQTITALNQFFESQDNASLAGLPPEEQVAKRLERLEKGGQQPRIQMQQPVEQQSTQTVQMLVGFVDAVGLKIDDKRIDWAPDVADPQIGFNRFAISVKKALTEDYAKAIQELKNNGEKEIGKLRKKAGVDKVSTSGPSGAGLPDISKMTPFEKLEYAFQQAEAANKT
jgi:hypothetical protein